MVCVIITYWHPAQFGVMNKHPLMPGFITPLHYRTDSDWPSLLIDE
jgi:hypothetical protein